jgi:hypothetical protein
MTKWRSVIGAISWKAPGPGASRPMATIFLSISDQMIKIRLGLRGLGPYNLGIALAPRRGRLRPSARGGPALRRLGHFGDSVERAPDPSCTTGEEKAVVYGVYGVHGAGRPRWGSVSNPHTVIPYRTAPGPPRRRRFWGRAGPGSGRSQRGHPVRMEEEWGGQQAAPPRRVAGSGGVCRRRTVRRTSSCRGRGRVVGARRPRCRRPGRGTPGSSSPFPR